MAPLQRIALAAVIFLMGTGFAFASQGTNGSEELRRTILLFVREWYGLPEEVEIEASAVQESHLPDFLETQVTMDDGKGKRSYSFFVSRDGRYLMEGVFRLTAHPENEVLQTMTVDGELFEGPASAGVTIVEYADLQCGACAKMHTFLKSQLLPRFENRIKIVYKEFPLPQVHDWALQGSMANQCAREAGPEAALRFRDLIFAHQSEINKENARDKLLEYGEQAGADRVPLAQCLDSKATLAHVRRSMAEGRRLAVRSTPTLFINGKRFTGNSTAAVLYRMVTDALAASEK